ncbi:STAS domain-containing protein [Streptomyces spongiicola]|uniref:Anti-sigma factor antagonist n=1 Tax=Streptomyces spongiicola TaxID=1690221 RepID=A0A2S1Z6E9_9ACTN|nr:STAS domain-containing protein [Streptomyces spongiicola]AWK11949.1 anti-sigma factor antagonist [Streptomyces spongiicola]GBP99016.1 STAS domain-containing protein [Streptomyces spongiicola]
MGQNLDVEVEIHDPGTAVVTIRGELDVDTATLLRHHLANQTLHGRRHLVLDLSAVGFMDSSGLNVLIRATRETRAMGGDLHLAAPVPQVAKLFDLTGLSLTTAVHEDVPAALTALGGAGTPS